ncbi:MAG: hypothetical protein KJZ47_13380, partial [Gemmatimonadales bacterium]|nr:hypothetical protein [Gemmatimonadales bacterium]
ALAGKPVFLEHCWRVHDADSLLEPSRHAAGSMPQVKGPPPHQDGAFHSRRRRDSENRWTI